MAGSLRLSGYKQFLKAADRAGKDAKREVRAAFRDVGDVVRIAAERDFARYDARTAAGFKVRVRQRGVAVEQSLRKTTGLRPDFGALQMRKALLPALDDNAGVVEARMEKALDRVADDFERGF